jgi:hypothetical protein
MPEGHRKSRRDEALNDIKTRAQRRRPWLTVRRACSAGTSPVRSRSSWHRASCSTSSRAHRSGHDREPRHDAAAHRQTQDGVPIADKEQGRTLDGGGSGRATWALRLDDEQPPATDPFLPVLSVYARMTGGQVTLNNTNTAIAFTSVKYDNGGWINLGVDRRSSRCRRPATTRSGRSTNGTSQPPQGSAAKRRVQC